MIEAQKNITLKQYLKNKNWVTDSKDELKDYVWLQHEKYSFIKYPVFHFAEPSDAEIKEVFKKSGAKLLSYAVQCSEKEANAYWYVCRKISKNELKDTIQRNIKKAEKNLTLKNVSAEELFTEGFQPYSEMRKRAGLDDFSHEHFIQHFKEKNIREHNFTIGAYHEGKLISYISLLVIDNFVEIEGPFTLNDALQYRPNEFLIYTALDYYINQMNIPLVTYGFSSIQEMNKESSLHSFKLKCGFEAIPINRKFRFSTELMLFVNPVSRFVVKYLTKLFPSNRMLRKINGVMQYSI